MALFEPYLLLFILIGIESDWKLNTPDGDNGQAIGPLQIHQGVVTDVNMKYRKNLMKYKHEDMRNRAFAGWVCIRYMEMYHAETYEEAARLWKSGPKWRDKKHESDAYWEDFKDRLKKLNRNEEGKKLKWSTQPQ